MDGMVTVGRVGGLFGNRGGLSLILFDSFPRDLNEEEPVFVEIDGHAVPLFFRSFRRRGQRGATAEFEDIDTDNRASELVGLELSMRIGTRAGRGVGDAGEADELFFEDLVGWEAVVDDGRTGRITAFFDSELNPLLEIELGGGRNDSSTETRRSAAGRRGTVEGNNAGGVTELIPAVDEFIVEIDEERRRVVFDLPEGLLGLNE